MLDTARIERLAFGNRLRASRLSAGNFCTTGLAGCGDIRRGDLREYDARASVSTTILWQQCVVRNIRFVARLAFKVTHDGFNLLDCVSVIFALLGKVRGFRSTLRAVPDFLLCFALERQLRRQLITFFQLVHHAHEFVVIFLSGVLRVSRRQRRRRRDVSKQFLRFARARAVAARRRDGALHSK